MANGVVVSSGTYIVSSGQTDTNDVVLAGGTINVSGTIINTVNSGGVDQIFSGGVASGTTVTAAGLEVVSSGGETISSTLSGPGGAFHTTEEVEALGVADALTVNAGSDALV